jgi:hypothetical protein
MQTYTTRKQEKSASKKEQATQTPARGVANSDILRLLGEVPSQKIDLPSIMAQRMYERFGIEMKGLNVYRDSGLEDMGQRAYARGNEIHIAGNESASDEKLMLHEATHVVQQGAGIANGSGILQDSGLEAQANATSYTGDFAMPTSGDGPVQGALPWKKKSKSDAQPQPVALPETAEQKVALEEIKSLRIIYEFFAADAVKSAIKANENPSRANVTKSTKLRKASEQAFSNMQFRAMELCKQCKIEPPNYVGQHITIPFVPEVQQQSVPEVQQQFVPEVQPLPVQEAPQPPVQGARQGNFHKKWFSSNTAYRRGKMKEEKNGGRWWNELPKEEQDAITEYTEDSDAINGFARSGNTDEESPIGKTLKRMKIALSKGKLRKDIRVSRGIKNDEPNVESPPVKEIRDPAFNGTFHDNAPMSTTIGENPPRDFNPLRRGEAYPLGGMVLDITIPAGTGRGAFVGENSFHPDEDEFLLAPGADLVLQEAIDEKNDLDKFDRPGRAVFKLKPKEEDK